MKDNFDNSLALILKFEGGYSNDPKDPGGPTNMGITKKTYDAYRRVKRLGTQSVVDISTGEVKNIYRREYADKIQFDRLPAGLDFALLDFAVNSGVSRAAKYIQKIVGTTTDGVIGSVTLAAIDAQPVNQLILNLCNLRRKFVRSLKTYKRFGKGWENRISTVQSKAYQMVEINNEGKQNLPEYFGDGVRKNPGKAAGTKTVRGAIATSNMARELVASVGALGATLSQLFEDNSNMIAIVLTIVIAGYLVYRIGSKVFADKD